MKPLLLTAMLAVASSCQVAKTPTEISEKTIDSWIRRHTFVADSLAKVVDEIDAQMKAKDAILVARIDSCNVILKRLEAECARFDSLLKFKPTEEDIRKEEEARRFLQELWNRLLREEMESYEAKPVLKTDI